MYKHESFHGFRSAPFGRYASPVATILGPDRAARQAILGWLVMKERLRVMRALAIPVQYSLTGRNPVLRQIEGTE